MTINRTSTLLMALALLCPITAQGEPAGLSHIEHIVVVYLENRSFDSLFGLFPGVNGLNDAQNAPPHHVDHTFYDTTSILKLIENRFGLAPLTDRDAKANDLQEAFEFNK